MTGRMAYGWQTDGGMAEYLLCKASSLVKMPDAMSYVDGAMLACGVSQAIFEENWLIHSMERLIPA